MPSGVGRPKLHSDIVTPLQLDFLRRFFAASFGPAFFLTGGTALAGFYFGHRLSDDLDLFTVADEVLPLTDAVVPRLAEMLDCEVVQKREAEYFRQYVLEPRRGEGGMVRLDLVRDFGPQYGERQAVAEITVDAIENIGANKLTAILGRTDAKDFVDLHFILKSGLDFDHLFRLAKEKDLGLTEFYLAQAMLEVRRFTRLPAMRAPLELPELQAQFTDLANALLDRLNPGKHPSQ